MITSRGTITIKGKKIRYYSCKGYLFSRPAKGEPRHPITEDDFLGYRLINDKLVSMECPDWEF
jgi:hypothetical protein